MVSNRITGFASTAESTEESTHFAQSALTSLTAPTVGRLPVPGLEQKNAATATEEEYCGRLLAVVTLFRARSGQINEAANLLISDILEWSAHSPLQTIADVEKKYLAVMTDLRALSGLATQLLETEPFPVGEPSPPFDPALSPPRVMRLHEDSRILLSNFGRDAEAAGTRAASLGLKLNCYFDGTTELSRMALWEIQFEALLFREVVNNFYRNILANDGPTGYRVLAKESGGNDWLASLYRRARDFTKRL